MNTAARLGLTGILIATGGLWLAEPGRGAMARDRVTRLPSETPAAPQNPAQVAAASTAAPAATPAPATPAPSPEIARTTPGVARGELNVTVDNARVIRLPEKTQTVIVGNPAIADFSVQRNGVVVVTGKSFGLTNIIALDNGGNLLAESVVSVSAPTNGIMIVQRGFDRQSYACTPLCQPSVNLGDATNFFNENRGQADAHNQFAVSR